MEPEIATSHSWTTWSTAIGGAFVVGLSGLVPLLLLPETTPAKRRRTSSVSQPAKDELINKKSLNRHLSFAVGSLLGDICLHLLPEVYSVEGADKRLLGLVILAGILSFLSIEKIFQFTQGGEGGSANPKSVTGYLNLLANCLDNFMHGLAVAASFLVSLKLGLVTSASILIHEIPHEVGDFTILLRSGFTRWEAGKMQFVTSTVGVAGAIAALSLDLDPESIETKTNWILAFSAGGFIHVALVSILPDLLTEEDPKETLVHLALILFGISVMWVLSAF